MDRIVPLGSVTTWLSGGTPSREILEFWNGDIPWISAATMKGFDLSDSDQHVTAEAVRSGSKMAPMGSTLLLVRGSALHNEIRACNVAGPLCFNQDVKALVPRRDIDSRFLTHSIQANECNLLKTVSSATNSAGVLDTRQTHRLLIWLPEANVQRQISQQLDDANDLIATLERLIAKKQAVKQGMMQQLLTGRTRLPGFTGEWTDIRLGDHVSYVKTVALSRAQLDTKSTLKYLHYGDIHTRPSVLLDAVSEEMPRAEMRLAARAGLLRRGDLVFADASEDPAGVGKSVEIVDTPDAGVVPGLHTIAARFDKSVLADGFKAYLQYIPSFREQLLRLAAGTKVLATTRSYVSSIILTLPDVTEQKAIAYVLHDSEREIDALRVRLSKARYIKAGMMQQLLTGRTRLPVEAAS